MHGAGRVPRRVSSVGCVNIGSAVEGQGRACAAASSRLRFGSAGNAQRGCPITVLVKAVSCFCLVFISFSFFSNFFSPLLGGRKDAAASGAIYCKTAVSFFWGGSPRPPPPPQKKGGSSWSDDGTTVHSSSSFGHLLPANLVLFILLPSFIVHNREILILVCPYRTVACLFRGDCVCVRESCVLLCDAIYLALILIPRAWRVFAGRIGSQGSLVFVQFCPFQWFSISAGGQERRGGVVSSQACGWCFGFNVCGLFD